MVVRVGELMGGLLSVGWRKGTEPGRKWPGFEFRPLISTCEFGGELRGGFFGEAQIGGRMWVRAVKALERATRGRRRMDSARAWPDRADRRGDERRERADGNRQLADRGR
jgi:hypothetical protein